MHGGRPGGGSVDSKAIDLQDILGAAGEISLSQYAAGIRGSDILKIAGQIRERLAAGETVLNLTVGDFRPDQFPVPELLRELAAEALRNGETNYPPVAGIPELREAVRESTRLDHGLDYPLASVLIGGGARPLLCASFMALIDAGDEALYPVPSWNNHHYAYLSESRSVPLPVGAAKNFHLDREDVEPYRRTARLLCLNSPLNPTGTCTSREALQGICELILEENRRREAAGERPFFLVYDQVYHSLTFGEARHVTPVGLVPEMAPYTILVDAVSKGMCGTGLRVGWAVGPPGLIAKMTQMQGHFGAWAPRPEQIATAGFLRNREALGEHRRWLVGELGDRLRILDEEFTAMREAGLPVTHIAPQGAMYLSVRFDLAGRSVRGRVIESDEDLREILLGEAGFGVVPFPSFGMEGEMGWVRISVGAVSREELRSGLARVRQLLENAG